MSASQGPAGRNLPFQATFRQVFGLLRLNHDALLRLAAAPLLLSFLLAILVNWLPSDEMAILALLLDLAPLTVFAVNWHRLVLLGPQACPPDLGLEWGRRQTVFLGRTLVLGVGLGLAAALPVILASRLLQASPIGVPLLLTAAAAVLFVAVRLSLVFPAAALDRQYGFGSSWRDTEGFGFQLLGLMLATGLPFWAGALLLHVFADSTGLATAAPYALLFVDRAVGYAAAAAGVNLLSVVYRRLSPGAPPTVQRA